MAIRFVGVDFPRRVAFSPKGSTLVLVNQDNVSDVYVAATEEELRNVPRAGGTPLLFGAGIGVRIAANGGQLNWTDYPGQLFAMASGAVGGNGTTSTRLFVMPG